MDASTKIALCKKIVQNAIEVGIDESTELWTVISCMGVIFDFEEGSDAGTDA